MNREAERRGAAPERPRGMTARPRRAGEVLVCEGDAELLSRLATVLREVGLRPVSTRSGRQAIAAARGRDLAAVVLSLELPDMAGVDACRELRARGEMPLIAICSAVPVPGEVEALRDCGVDDFVTKPFSARELILRLSVVLRRNRRNANNSGAAPAQALRAGDLALDEDARRVEVRGKEVQLTPIEYELLHYLMRRPEHVVTYDALVQHLWGTSAPGADERNTLRSHMSNLRRKLGRHGAAEHIRTEIRVGYRFVSRPSGR